MSLTTPKQRTVQHFTHDHSLTELNTTGYICNGCKTFGSGKTYRCEPCNYDLHEYCATCPLTLKTFLHPQHELTLVVRNQQSKRENNRLCDICNESIEGLFYKCNLCDFDVHPLCMQLPQHVKHVLHPAHQLEFRLGEASTCNVCHGPCQSWRYGCEFCKFDIHMECILAVCDTSPSGTKSRGLKQPAGQPPPFAAGQPPQFAAGQPPPFAPWQHPHFSQPYYAYGPMGPQPYYNYQQPYYNYQQPYYNYHPYNFNYMNPGHVPVSEAGQVPVAEAGQVPNAEAGQTPTRSKGWRMFFLVSRITIGAVSTVFGVPIII